MKLLLFQSGKTRIKIIGFEKELESQIDETYKKYAVDIQVLWGFKPKLTLSIQPAKCFIETFLNLPIIIGTLVFNLFIASFLFLISQKSLTVINSIYCAILAVILLVVDLSVVLISVQRWKNSLGWTSLGFFNIVTFVNGAKNCAEGPGEIVSTVSHELVHAYAKKTNLPLWLDEGLAYLTPVKLGLSPENNYKLGDWKNPPPSRRKERIERDGDYWVVKYLDEVHHDILMQTISKKRNRKQHEIFLKRQLGIQNKLRIRLEELAYKYYTSKPELND
jgi:hypothetical protein